MPESLPDPPVPAGCDLRDFPFIPLHIEQLRRSKAWLICKRRPELAFYMINLWTASWHSLPAASLEDDDDVLADLAMCDPKAWAKVRDGVLRGWKKCEADGRLYHPIVADKAREAWQAKIEQRRKTLGARIARMDKRLEGTMDQTSRADLERQVSALRQELSQGLSQSPSQTPQRTNTRSITDEQEDDPPPVTKDVTKSVTSSKGEGQGQGTKESPHSPPEGGGRVPRRFRNREEPRELHTPEHIERNMWVTRLKYWLKSDYWGPMYGPKHGERGFQGPPDLAAMSVEQLRETLLGSDAA